MSEQYASTSIREGLRCMCHSLMTLRQSLSMVIDHNVVKQRIQRCRLPCSVRFYEYKVTGAGYPAAHADIVSWKFLQAIQSFLSNSRRKFVSVHIYSISAMHDRFIASLLLRQACRRARHPAKAVLPLLPFPALSKHFQSPRPRVRPALLPYEATVPLGMVFWPLDCGGVCVQLFGRQSTQRLGGNPTVAARALCSVPPGIKPTHLWP
ncbi:hypothetical protein OBBRIDRAFT_654305 [Obba rivulosa]|uniref:Uncharacterized protein n=1 Tax=Obba rivulosa TaxID=1052685 RepID=A0A8E2ASM2_9APHY|nr:hypothetical protein OBBRIDRAFT_654305 [Obba rivulosa]